MSSTLACVCIDALDPARMAAFWARLLGRQVSSDGTRVLAAGSVPFDIQFVHTEVPKTAPLEGHFDLTSTSLDDQQGIVDRALSLGAEHLDVGQLPEEGHVVLADPEGNEFCVIPPDNNFLAGIRGVGALAGDGSQAAGYFWSAALGWPLVWDQDEETAIQSPLGGPKLTWGGPPLDPKVGKARVHFDLIPAEDSDQATEVSRLESLGASRVDIGQGDVPWVVMADPDGHEFCVL